VPTSTGRLAPGWFYGTIACGSVGMVMTAPLTALYAKELGASDAVAALIVSVMALSFLCLDLVASRVVPRVDARLALAGGYAVFGVGSFASAVAPDLTVMTLARVLQGFAAAFPMGAGFHMALRLARPGRQGSELARFNAASFTGMTIGPLGAGAIADAIGGETGMRWAFAACGVVNLATALLALRVLPSVRSGERPRFGLPAREVFTGTRTRQALVAAGLGFGLRGIIGMTLLPLLGDELGATAALVAIATTVLAVAELGGTMVAGRLADVVGRRPVTVGSSTVSALMLVAVMLTPTVPVLVVMCAFLGFTMAALRVVPAATVVDVAESDEAAAVGWRIACDVNGLVTAAVLSIVIGLAGLEGGFVYAALAAGAVGLLAASIGETHAVRTRHPELAT
jgi:DHA1 family inner membrane transport protein